MRFHHMEASIPLFQASPSHACEFWVQIAQMDSTGLPTSHQLRSRSAPTTTRCPASTHSELLSSFRPMSFLMTSTREATDTNANGPPSVSVRTRFSHPHEIPERKSMPRLFSTI